MRFYIQYLSITIFAFGTIYSLPAFAMSEEEDDLYSFAQDIQFEVTDPLEYTATKLQQIEPAASEFSKPRLKFYDSVDGQWNAGIGLTTLDSYVGEDQTKDADSILNKTAPFLNIKYQFRQKK